MQFGRTDQLPEEELILPPDDPGNSLLYHKWSQHTPGKLVVYVGAPVWGHPGFVGRIYPKGTKSKDFLQHYARHFNCVELSATYYGLPPAEQVHRWRDTVPKTFRFSPKFPQAISHDQDLPEKIGLTDAFIATTQALGDRLGMAFLQLPPSFGPDRLEELYHYLQQLPPTLRLGVEFRHPLLFRDAAAYADWGLMLQEARLAAVITDTVGRRDVLHQRLCSDTLFVRWTGNNGHPSDQARLDHWVNRLAYWVDKGLQTIYFYVHQPEEEHSIASAVYLTKALNQRLGLSLTVPRVIPQVIQQSLFGN